MPITDNIARVIYNRCTQDVGTISYPIPYNGGTLLVRERFTVPRELRRRLKKINSTLDFKWDRYRKIWNLVHQRPGDLPYVVMAVTDKNGNYIPINDKTFQQLEYNLWWSAQGIKQQAEKLTAQQKYQLEKTKERQKLENKEVAKEIAPLIATLGDAGTASHGNSKFLFQGFGEGK